MEGLYFSWEINKPHLHQIYCTESWLMSISYSSLAFSHPGLSHKHDKTKQSSDTFIWYYRYFIRDTCCGVGVLTSENAADKCEAWLFFLSILQSFFIPQLNIYRQLYCRAKAKDRNFDFWWKLVIDVFGTFKISFIMYISILSQFPCFSEKIMGRLNRNFKNQGRTPYNTGYCSLILLGTLKMSYAGLPLFTRASIWSYGASLELYGVLPFLLSIKVCSILITV